VTAADASGTCAASANRNSTDLIRDMFCSPFVFAFCICDAGGFDYELRTAAAGIVLRDITSSE
jgi:hypothetical protein